MSRRAQHNGINAASRGVRRREADHIQSEALDGLSLVNPFDLQPKTYPPNELVQDVKAAVRVLVAHPTTQGAFYVALTLFAILLAAGRVVPLSVLGPSLQGLLALFFMLMAFGSASIALDVLFPRRGALPDAPQPQAATSVSRRLKQCWRRLRGTSKSSRRRSSSREARATPRRGRQSAASAVIYDDAYSARYGREEWSSEPAHLLPASPPALCYTKGRFGMEGASSFRLRAECPDAIADRSSLEDHLNRGAILQGLMSSQREEENEFAAGGYGSAVVATTGARLQNAGSRGPRYVYAKCFRDTKRDSLRVDKTMTDAQLRAAASRGYDMLGVRGSIGDWSLSMSQWLFDRLLRPRVRELARSNEKLTRVIQALYERTRDGSLLQFKTPADKMRCLEQLVQSRNPIMEPSMRDVVAHRQYLDSCFARVDSQHTAYVRQRVLQLAEHDFLRDYAWNSGGPSDDGAWSPGKPTDATLLMFMFLHFMDEVMYPLSFSERHFQPDDPVKYKKRRGPPLEGRNPALHGKAGSSGRAGQGDADAFAGASSGRSGGGKLGAASGKTSAGAGGEWTRGRYSGLGRDPHQERQERLSKIRSERGSGGASIVERMMAGSSSLLRSTARKLTGDDAAGGADEDEQENRLCIVEFKGDPSPCFCVRDRDRVWPVRPGRDNLFHCLSIFVLLAAEDEELRMDMDRAQLFEVVDVTLPSSSSI